MNKSILITTSVLISFLCFISCQEDKNKEIETLLNELYQSKMPDSNLLKNSKIWSSKRINQFDYIQRLTLMDQERISKSNIPTDKPILLEEIYLCTQRLSNFTYSDVLAMPTYERRYYLSLFIRETQKKQEFLEETNQNNVNKNSKGNRTTRVSGDALKNKLMSGQIPNK
jgi:hypothetical protein